MKNEKKIYLSSGSPYPLGVSQDSNGINFSLYSSSAKNVSLSFFSPKDKNCFYQCVLDPKENKTNDLWHIHINNLPKNVLYAYQIDENWVIDPNAKKLYTSKIWGEKQDRIFGEIPQTDPFEWETDRPLNIAFHQLIIYEMHVRGFTKDPTSHVKHPGTFLGLIEKIPYLKDLGINAVEILPVFEFDETENFHQNPITNQSLFNYWGYSTINFFSPMARYGTQKDFKEMVKALHRAKIEIILDVVFNHTGNATLEQIDKETYFILDKNKEHTNYTGCGNTINSNHPIVIDWILSSLKYWVVEMHVDGFRFDLASIFCRDSQGNVLEKPPIIEAINADPELKNTKFIAEPWDCAGLYQVGSFPGNHWAEWNAKFRDIARRFIKGTNGQAKFFASILTGSEDLFKNGKTPHQSINFITAHDGFTLKDLVSYNEKHNEENGEANQDGYQLNESWNCGKEGPTTNSEIEALREKQIRNFLLSLSVSIGTPMFLMGDEYGHTKQGNNNAYCQDNQKNYFLWNALKDPFLQKLLAFRKNTPSLQRKNYCREKDIEWHGHMPRTPLWGEESRFVAYTLFGKEKNLYLAFNANFEPAQIRLPSPSKGKKWKRFVDTSLPNAPEKGLKDEYVLDAYSSLILIES